MRSPSDSVCTVWVPTQHPMLALSPSKTQAPPLPPNLPSPSPHQMQPPAVVPILSLPCQLSQVSFWPVNSQVPQPFHLSSQTCSQLSLILAQSLTDSMLLQYAQEVKKHDTFCDHDKNPPKTALHSQRTSLMGCHSLPCTNSRRQHHKVLLGRPKTWHSMYDMPWKGGIRLLCTVRGVGNLSPPLSRCSPRPPIMGRMLLKLKKCLNLDSLFYLVVCCSACDTFWGQCCMGELL